MAKCYLGVCNQFVPSSFDTLKFGWREVNPERVVLWDVNLGVDHLVCPVCTTGCLAGFGCHQCTSYTPAFVGPEKKIVQCDTGRPCTFRDLVVVTPVGIETEKSWTWYPALRALNYSKDKSHASIPVLWNKKHIGVPIALKLGNDVLRPAIMSMGKVELNGTRKRVNGKWILGTDINFYSAIYNLSQSCFANFPGSKGGHVRVVWGDFRDDVRTFIETEGIVSPDNLLSWDKWNQ